MRIAYLDCFSGISGDMFLGALVDAGLSFEKLKEHLNGLNITGYHIDCRKVNKRGIAAIKVTVKVTGNQPARHPGEIQDMIRFSDLPAEVKEVSCKVFKRLAEAEAKVHGVPPDRVHFHEVGAVDAIVDITGTALGLHLLGVERVYASPLPLGGGTAECKHGLIPVPSPATLELVKGIPARKSPAYTELVTPTGAALISTLAHAFGPIPPMTIRSVGYGAGTKDLPHANVLRIIMGELEEGSGASEFDRDNVVVLETNIDDMNPEFYTYLGSSVMSSGALDFFITPVYMKKNRPGIKITVLCPDHLTNKIASIIFSETSSLGCRIRREDRIKVKRSTITVETPYGSVDVKYNCETGTVSPEYSHCERLAATTGTPLKTIYDLAKAEAMKKLGFLS